MLESPNQHHLKGKQMWMNKFITVFVYGLRLCTGGLFEKIMFSHYGQCIGEMRQRISGTLHHTVTKPTPFNRSVHREMRQQISGTIHHTVTKPTPLNRSRIKDEQVCFGFRVRPQMAAILNHQMCKPYSTACQLFKR